MGINVRDVSGVTTPEMLSLFGGGFSANPHIPIDTTFSAVTIRVSPSGDHDEHLELGDFRTVQMVADGGAGSGTISSSFSAITGTGTLFLSELSVGDYLQINQGGGTGGIALFRVATITDDTHLSLASSLSFDVTDVVYTRFLHVGNVITVAGPDAEVTGDFGGVFVPQGTDAYFEILRNGSDPYTTRMAVEYTAGTNGTMFGFPGLGTFYSFTPPAGDTFLSLTGQVSSAVESDVQTVWPLSGTFKNLVARMSDLGFVSSTESIEVVLRINGVDTALVLNPATVSPGGGHTFTRNDADEVSVTAGDLVSIRFTILSGGGAEEEGWGGSGYVVFEPA